MIAKYKRYSKFILLAVLLIVTIQLSYTLSVHAETEAESDTDTLIEEQSESDEAQDIKKQLEIISDQGVKDIFPEFDPQKILSDAAKGKLDFSVTGMINRVGKYLVNEIFINVHVLVKLIVLVTFCAILKNLQTSFLSESVGELAFYTCYIVMVTIMIVSLSTALNLGRDIIDTMVNFMHATIPALITLLISGGNITSAGVFQPLLVMVVEVSATIIKNVFIPLIFLSAILSIVDNISEKMQISRLAQFLKQINFWFLGILMTVFIAVVSVQGSMGAVVDGVTSKTAKFTISAAIPVAGKYLADAADAVIGCTLLLKNAAGVAVMIGILGLCIVPILKIASLVLLYRITCILVEPIADKRITSCINEMAGAMAYILGITASVAFMFLISVTAIIGASNISAMVR